MSGHDACRLHRRQGRAASPPTGAAVPVEGIEAISGDNGPAWVLVGEFTETAEAPAAVADIACHLATDERNALCRRHGLSRRRHRRRDADDRKPGRDDREGRADRSSSHIGGEDHPYAVHDKSKAEKAWAQALTEKVSAAGARARAALCFAR